MYIVFLVDDSDGTSFITLLTLLDNSLRALRCCLGRLGLTLCEVVEKIFVLVCTAIDI